jgi:hypothetical protein
MTKVIIWAVESISGLACEDIIKKMAAFGASMLISPVLVVMLILVM